MPEVLAAYSIAILLVAIILILAFLIGRSMRGASHRTRAFLNLIGGVILAVALLEKAGWSVRPWAAGSPAAYFNDVVFRVLLLAGFGLLFVSWTAALADRSPRP